MDGNTNAISFSYAQFIAKEACKESAARIFDTVRNRLHNALPGEENATLRQQALDALSDAECDYYNTFRIEDVIADILEF
ncbi:hypothetical protein [Desulfovibrio inopinatus]|uniref:hypothetical protein n=1 Tax=Desulfovibrio inopinatus TaxID=102109 RepID=UPI00041370DB|nr:hypothetical protein [Desulfovibrio inopinatus]